MDAKPRNQEPIKNLSSIGLPVYQYKFYQLVITRILE